MTADELRRIMPYASAVNINTYAPLLTATMHEFEIDKTVERVTMFIAQVAHESGSLRYTEEIASGHAYEGRADLGNLYPGDGPLFKGHGLIQLTGRKNHEAYAFYKGMTIEQLLEYIQTPVGATNVAGWYWMTNHLNDWCDKGDFLAVSSIINTGRPNRPATRINGYDVRLAYWKRATAVLA
jgi:putative chitinase